MEIITIWLLLILGVLWGLSLGYFAWVSWKEKERRATRLSFVFALAGVGLFGLFALLPHPLRLGILAGMGLAGLTALLLFLWPIGQVVVGPDTPAERFDERRIMFARARLLPGSPEFEAYYRAHPQDQAGDEATRRLPGLMSPDSRFYESPLFASPEGSFFLTEVLRNAVQPGAAAGSEPADRPAPASPEASLDPAAMTAYLKSLARYYGALQVGVTELQPYHVYSHIGRGTGQYGAEIPFEGGYAIAFTVEMDFEMVAAAPRGATLMESARQYVESARVAVQLAAAIRALGYPARAHIDGNYRVIAPLVGRDAGLGEIGRMSLLMAPRHGPRLRLGVVTTQMPLLPDGRRPDPALIDFCNLCQKCVHNCPGQAIPAGPRQLQDGFLRWKLDPQACFRYWNIAGTDCGRCLAVCPYAHPDNLAHNLVRWGIARSGAFRRLAVWLDDLFYGKRPKPHAAPAWTRINRG
ncbi:MAG: 4Fe-4S dicluster domain-containing protein [Anaerolineales bacterium]|nr:4Fe-4S dicluster domain-containing protein [Anaerolineales bacterium]